MKTASEMSGHAPAAHPVSDLTTRQFAENCLDVVIKGGKSNRNVFERMGELIALNT
jgi:hypothetical protein